MKKLTLALLKEMVIKELKGPLKHRKRKNLSGAVQGRRDALAKAGVNIKCPAGHHIRVLTSFMMRLVIIMVKPAICQPVRHLGQEDKTVSGAQNTQKLPRF